MTVYPQTPFLDLNFNGRWVSDFGLIVVTDSNMAQENLFADFEHTTEVVPGKTGTLYWGTQVTGRTITKHLATDGMSSRQYANFRRTFGPGIYGKFYTAEAPYKYGYAYIQDNSTFDFVPFDSQLVTNAYTYKDTVYKGKCSLTFFFPDPLFYSNWIDYNHEAEWDGAKWVSKGRTDSRGTDWFIESGLLYNPWVASSPAVQLAMGAWHGTKPTGALTTFTAYHAGNARAPVKLSYIYKIPDATSTISATSLWSEANIGSGTIRVRIPRLLKDVIAVDKLIYPNFAKVASNPTEYINQLREELDGPAKGILLRMVLSISGAGTPYTTNVIFRTALLDLVKNKEIGITIDAMKQESLLTMTLVDPTDSKVYNLVENIADSTDNKFFFLEGTNGPTISKTAATVPLQKVAISAANATLWEFFFHNTYE